MSPDTNKKYFIIINFFYIIGYIFPYFDKNMLTRGTRGFLREKLTQPDPLEKQNLPTRPDPKYLRARRMKVNYFELDTVISDASAILVAKKLLLSHGNHDCHTSLRFSRINAI